jgi:hypothetical protein
MPTAHLNVLLFPISNISKTSRWNVALSKNESISVLKLENHCRATIVYEYIIQASDVAHLAWSKGVAGELDPSVGR